MVKPSLDEVLSYVETKLPRLLHKHARMLPQEQHEEIKQDARIRIIEKYDEIDAAKTWQAYAKSHCVGAIKDYKKKGDGFSEDRKSLGNNSAKKMRYRLELTDLDGDEVSIDQILGENNKVSWRDLEGVEINWDLVSRLARRDKNIRALALYIRGHTLAKIGEHFDLSPQRVWAMIRFVIDEFDRGDWRNHDILQAMYAFGLCEFYGVKKEDQSEVFGYKIGWGAEPFDLDHIEPHESLRIEQMTFSFEEAESQAS